MDEGKGVNVIPLTGLIAKCKLFQDSKGLNSNPRSFLGNLIRRKISYQRLY